MALQGDAGGASLLRDLPEGQRVPLDAPAARDIDTVAALARAEAAAPACREPQAHRSDGLPASRRPSRRGARP